MASAQIELAVHISAQIKLEQFAFELIGIELCGYMVEKTAAHILRAVHISAQMLERVGKCAGGELCGDIAILDISAHFHRSSSALDASLHKRMDTVFVSLHKSYEESISPHKCYATRARCSSCSRPRMVCLLISDLSSSLVLAPRCPWFWRFVGLLGPGDQQFHLVWHVLGGHRIGVVVRTGCEHAQGHRLVGMSSACAEISTEVHVVRAQEHNLGRVCRTLRPSAVYHDDGWFVVPGSPTARSR